MPRIYLADNRVTIKCEDGYPGFKQKVNGLEYEVVDLETLQNHAFINSNLSRLCTSLITNLSGLFKNRKMNQYIGNWDLSNVTNMSDLFRGSAFNQPLDFWDVSKV